MLVILIYDSKKEKKEYLALSSAVAELVVDSKEDKQISDHGVVVEQKVMVTEKDVSEGKFPIDDTKKELMVDKREEMQISCHAEDVD